MDTAREQEVCRHSKKETEEPERQEYPVHNASGKLQRMEWAKVSTGGNKRRSNGQMGVESNRKGQDPSGMGRWTHITIALKGVKITFVSAYRVCKQATDLDKNTAYMQQWRVLAENQT